jgi:hypothetical protein
MVADWTLWATFIALGAGVAIVATYLQCRAQIEQTRNRIVLLEREVALARLREESNERKLAHIFEAVVALRELTEIHLCSLREKLDQLLADGV